MPEAYIVDAIRTAGGKRGGKLAGVHPVDLGAHVLDQLVANPLRVLGDVLERGNRNRKRTRVIGSEPRGLVLPLPERSDDISLRSHSNESPMFDHRRPTDATFHEDGIHFIERHLRDESDDSAGHQIRRCNTHVVRCLLLRGHPMLEQIGGVSLASLQTPCHLCLRCAAASIGVRSIVPAVGQIFTHAPTSASVHPASLKSPSFRALRGFSRMRPTSGSAATMSSSCWSVLVVEIQSCWFPIT